ITSVAFSPDDTRIAASCHDGTVQLWDPAGGRRVGSPLRHPFHVGSLAFSPEGKILYTAFGQSTRSGLMRWDVERGESLDPPIERAIVPRSEWVHRVVLSPDGRVLLLADSLSLQRRDAATLQPLGPPRVVPTLWGLAFAPDSRSFITCHGRYG